VVADAARLACVGKSEPGIEFVDFFREEYPGLVRSLYLLTADLGEAEELAEEAMARAFERWGRVRLMESPGGYVYRTAVNLNRKRLRHLAVRARRLVFVAARRPDPQRAETWAELAAAMASIPVDQREAFMLVEWLGLSAEEAGRLLGIKASSVRSRLHRARAALRERLGEDGERA
jgi:RNA polymerase sigma-70 factor (ECF subfamily)